MLAPVAVSRHPLKLTNMLASISKLAPAAGVLLACSVIVGCTDPEPIEPPQPSPASQEAFASEMRSLCDPVIEARARLLLSRTRGQLQERSSLLLLEQEMLARETRGVTPPAGAADAVRRYADALAVAVETSRSVLGGTDDATTRLELASDNARAQLALFEAKGDARVPEGCPPYGDVELEAFRAEANLACHQLGEDLAAAGRIELDAGSEQQSAGLISVLHDVLQDFQARLEAAAPSELANQLVDHFLALHQKRAATFDRLGAAYLQERRSAYYRAVRDYRRLSLAADAVARRAQIHSCVRFDSE
jgi:hypothetical protein